MSKVYWLFRGKIKLVGPEGLEPKRSALHAPPPGHLGVGTDSMSVPWNPLAVQVPRGVPRIALDFVLCLVGPEGLEPPTKRL